MPRAALQLSDGGAERPQLSAPLVHLRAQADHDLLLGGRHLVELLWTVSQPLARGDSPGGVGPPHVVPAAIPSVDDRSIRAVHSNLLLLVVNLDLEGADACPVPAAAHGQGLPR
eukprot:CAMPEP_0168416968 /NCGR_PEP_ID=MMETSP0228-20121227/31014_1 /TAXON_ID=133427 /ORGANISM="Protoceratium reticulatum, Strain CCCM 535 (=CCMP 1889)" /LENGTH=113 /DNA_ID=CAMNT_0008430811 /DNA_START=26 /DNA_END=364 /DNA_ORIENTATION=-